MSDVELTIRYLFILAVILVLVAYWAGSNELLGTGIAGVNTLGLTFTGRNAAGTRQEPTASRGSRGSQRTTAAADGDDDGHAANAQPRAAVSHVSRKGFGSAIDSGPLQVVRHATLLLPLPPPSPLLDRMSSDCK